jgi:hypothetical protein
VFPGRYLVCEFRQRTSMQDSAVGGRHAICPLLTRLACSCSCPAPASPAPGSSAAPAALRTLRSAVRQLASGAPAAANSDMCDNCKTVVTEAAAILQVGGQAGGQWAVLLAGLGLPGCMSP